MSDGLPFGRTAVIREAKPQGLERRVWVCGKYNGGQLVIGLAKGGGVVMATADLSEGASRTVGWTAFAVVQPARVWSL